jgi:hypothetical protein
MYIGNKPFKCLRRWIGAVISVLIFAILFLTIPIIGICLYAEWIIEEVTWVNIGGLILCAAALVYFGWFQLLRDFRENFICRIVPYFERRLGAIEDAFETGIELCRECRRLDEVSFQSGVPIFSSFGFRDDRDGQKLVWHSPENALQTVEKLIASKLVLNSPLLLNDLKRLEYVLKDAEKQGIRFCLIVRGGLDKMISPVEMDNRKGFFW